MSVPGTCRVYAPIQEINTYDTSQEPGWMTLDESFILPIVTTGNAPGLKPLSPSASVLLLAPRASWPPDFKTEDTPTVLRWGAHPEAKGPLSRISVSFRAEKVRRFGVLLTTILGCNYIRSRDMRPSFCLLIDIYGRPHAILGAELSLSAFRAYLTQFRNLRASTCLQVSGCGQQSRLHWRPQTPFHTPSG